MTGNELKQTITDLVGDMARRDFMRIADLLEMLPSTVRPAEAKQALLELYHGRVILLEAQPFAHRVTARDRAASVQLGGDSMELVKLGRWG